MRQLVHWSITITAMPMYGRNNSWITCTWTSCLVITCTYQVTRNRDRDDGFQNLNMLDLPMLLVTYICTLMLLSTAPEKILPRDTVRQVTLPSWRANVWEHVINSVFQTWSDSLILVIYIPALVSNSFSMALSHIFNCITYNWKNWGS